MINLKVNTYKKMHPGPTAAYNMINNDFRIGVASRAPENVCLG